MLGKCIKNEFVNRTKQALGIICTLIGMALFTRIFNAIGKASSIPAVDVFSALTNVIFVVVIIAALVMTAFLPFLDFRQRFYKDQAYLTHTLPVKVSTMIMARMVCDLVITVTISLSWVVALIVAYGRDVYVNILDLLETLFGYLGGNSAQENTLLVGIFILFVIGACLSTLNSIWLTNASYSFGHAFSKNKKLLSVVGIVVFYSLETTFMMIIVFVCDKIGFMTSFEVTYIEDLTVGVLRSIFEVMIVMDIISFVMVFAMGAITNFICKRHLNVE